MTALGREATVKTAPGATERRPRENAPGSGACCRVVGGLDPLGPPNAAAGRSLAAEKGEVASAQPGSNVEGGGVPQSADATNVVDASVRARIQSLL